MNYFSKNILRRTLAIGLGSVAVIMTSLSGCKKANPLGLGGCDDATKNAMAFSEAIQAFSENPSVANCNKMKKIGEDYLKAARKCSIMNVREEAEEALAEWSDMDCSEMVENGN